MARTPRTRGGSKSEPTTADVLSGNAAQPSEPAAADAPAEFAASESLTPPDDAAPIPAEPMSEPPLSSLEEEKALAEPPATRAGTSPVVSPEPAAFLAPDAQTPSESARLQEPATESVLFESVSGNDTGTEAGESRAPEFASIESEPVSGLMPSSSEEEKALAEPPATPVQTAPDGLPEPDDVTSPDALTPGENAALEEPPAQSAAFAPVAEDAAATGNGEAAPETPEAADSFRFSSELAPTLPDEVRRNEDTSSDPVTTPASSDAAEMEGPGIAATPVVSPLAGEPSLERAPDYAASAAREPASVPEPARRGGGGLFAAGLLGGVAALLLAGLLQYFGFLPSIGAGGQTGGGNTQAFQSEIDGLKSQIASLKEAGTGTTAAADPALRSAVDALKADVAQLKSAGSGTAAVPPELEARVAAAEQKLAGLDGAASADQLAALSGKVSAAETLAQNNETAVKDAAARIGALEQNFSGVQGSVSGLSTSLSELQKRMETLGAQPRVALALAASALKEAADRGAPFTAELATLGTLAPDAPEIKQLQPYAESGVPTRETLLADWNSRVDAVLASANPPDADQGIMGRLMSGAGSLVSVRPIGAVEGTSMPATVGRIQAAMEAGDLGKALAEYDTLPDAAKQAAADFAEKARARLAAESLVNQAITNASKAA